MGETMTFPETVEEFMEQYKIVDREQVYTNGAELVPIFRMKQWFEHEKAQLSQEGTTYDTISRQAVIDALHTWFRDGFDEDKWWNSTHVLAAIEGLHPVQQEHKWETCFECPLSHGCPKIKGCTNEQAIEYASQIPNDCPLSAQPEPQWIPVSERLPEDMQFVLLTVRRLKNGYNHEPFISVGYIGWNHQHWWCAHDGDCEISKVEVIAWMPLPEAYKPSK